MSDHFKVGDKVVCVKSDSNERCPVSPIVEGHIYKILHSASDGEWGGVINQPCVQVKADDIAFNAAWYPQNFRLLPPADEEFTRQMRAIKPKATVDA